MPSLYGTNTRLRSTNFANRIATNAKPKASHAHFLDGLIGILRWVGIGIEVLGTIAATLIPGAQFLVPIITIAGSVFQSSLDAVSLANSKRRGSDIASFGVSLFLNMFSLGTALKGTYGASRNILRISTSDAREGFRYVVRGTEEFNEAAKSLINGARVEKGFTSVQRVRVIDEQKLIRQGIVKPFSSKKVVNEFERELQKEFSSTFTKADEYGGVVSARAGRDKYLAKEGNLIMSNRDLAITRRGISQYASGKISSHEFARLFATKVSSGVKEQFGIIRQGGRFFFKNPELEGLFLKRVDRIKEFYGSKIIPQIIDITPKGGVRLWFEDVIDRISNKKAFSFFGTSRGRKLTQTVQLSNPNDLAREIVNHGERWLLNGFKITKGMLKGLEVKGIRQYISKLRNFMETKYPELYKIVQLGTKTKLFRIYKEIRKGLEENGTLTKDDTFLMGWRIINEATNWREVVLYFNPNSTNAKTPGSYNYGGKKAIHTVLSKKTLDILKVSDSPGHLYLLGGEGIAPIALSSGGKAATDFSISEDLFMLMTLHMPIEPLRNILSVVSNVKASISNIAKGTYIGRFKPTFLNTLERLWESKASKILGNVLGGVLSNEVSGHVSRLLKGTLQGFTKTKSTTKIINGHKLHFTRTTFSFNNNYKYKPVLKQAFGQNVISASLKRLPTHSHTAPSTTRDAIKNKRYGTQIRRIGSVFKI